MKPDKESCKEFDGKMENGVCMVDGFPMEVGQRSSNILKYRRHSQEYRKMSPRNFLRLATPLNKGMRKEKTIKKLKERIENEEPINPLYMDVREDSGRVTSHEGRHRAIACREEKEKCKKVPVILFHRTEDHGFTEPSKGITLYPERKNKSVVVEG